jgi:hypothetical protein|uniref:Uncharacterized protein n=1 Tax=Zea mays TaxID=4577 RepID=C0P9X7_MAIZE|nr:unknown [Zea mays]
MYLYINVHVHHLIIIRATWGSRRRLLRQCSTQPLPAWWTLQEQEQEIGLLVQAVPMAVELGYTTAAAAISWRCGTPQRRWITATPAAVRHQAALTRVAQLICSCRHAAAALSRHWTSSPLRALDSRTSAAAPSRPLAPHPLTNLSIVIIKSL